MKYTSRSMIFFPLLPLQSNTFFPLKAHREQQINLTPRPSQNGENDFAINMIRNVAQSFGGEKFVFISLAAAIITTSKRLNSKKHSTENTQSSNRFFLFLKKKFIRMILYCNTLSCFALLCIMLLFLFSSCLLLR